MSACEEKYSQTCNPPGLLEICPVNLGFFLEGGDGIIHFSVSCHVVEQGNACSDCLSPSSLLSSVVTSVPDRKDVLWFRHLTLWKPVILHVYMLGMVALAFGFLASDGLRD